MRYISLKNQQPDPAWLTKAEALLEQLKAAPDAEARKTIIDKNSHVWGELKGWLSSLSGGKCWFTQAEDVASHYEVEHFRPKKSAKDADGTEHDGYWWLAFDWENFRLCTNVPNRKKSTYFPLDQGCNRASYGDDVRYEIPMLLDPTDPNDPPLLSFNMVGDAIPSSAADTDWEQQRVRYSIERYNLNDHPPLVAQRKIIWNTCVNAIKNYRAELGKYNADHSNAVAKNECDTQLKVILELISNDQALSCVARACILSTNDPRLTALLQAA